MNQHNSDLVLNPLALSRVEAAKLLNMSTVSLDRLTRKGLIRVCRVLRRPRYTVEELRRFLKESTKADY